MDLNVDDGEIDIFFKIILPPLCILCRDNRERETSERIKERKTQKLMNISWCMRSKKHQKMNNNNHDIYRLSLITQNDNG